MSEPIDYLPAPPVLATLRAAGRVYRKRQAAADEALALIRQTMVSAYECGWTITQLSEATGLSRFAVARAVRQVQDQ